MTVTFISAYYNTNENKECEREEEEKEKKNYMKIIEGLKIHENFIILKIATKNTHIRTQKMPPL